MAPVDPVALITAADEQVAKVRTQGKDYSFNELLSMYEDNELVINPDFQRLFRWTEEKESRFIESLILELPLPPLFVIEVEDGKYELIDGLQRFSTYLHFRGKLSAPHKKIVVDGIERGIQVGDFLALVDCDIVPQLNELTYSDLPRALEVKLKRHTVRVEVIRKESDKRLRYHMFKRLNSGGIELEEQEIRNCTIRLLGNTINEFIINCSEQLDFKNCIANVSESQLEKRFDQELVLRFFAMKNWRDAYVHEIGAFLTEYLEAVSDTPPKLRFDCEVQRREFDKTFQVLNAAVGSDAFSMVVRRSAGGQSKYPFSVLHFEAFTLGMQPHLNRLDPGDTQQMEKLTAAINAIKNDDDFIKLTTGGGKNTKGSLDKRVQFVSGRVGTVL
ncbi:MAG: DUF262 domain-containing protein [Pirellulales bacterium]